MKCTACGSNPLNPWKSHGLFYCRPCYMAGCKAPAQLAPVAAVAGPCASPGSWKAPALVKGPFYFHASCLGGPVYAPCPDEFSAQVALAWGKLAANVSAARFSSNPPKPRATHCPEIPGAALKWLRRVLAGEILPNEFAGRSGDFKKASFLAEWPHGWPPMTGAPWPWQRS